MESSESLLMYVSFIYRFRSRPHSSTPSSYSRLALRSPSFSAPSQPLTLSLHPQEDMRRGWQGGELEVKDLEFLWDKLEEEEGIRWNLQDTVVLTDNPAHMRAQPHNFILVPRFNYRSTVAAQDDQFLLMMVAALKGESEESRSEESRADPPSPSRPRNRDQLCLPHQGDGLVQLCTFLSPSAASQ